MLPILLSILGTSEMELAATELGKQAAHRVRLSLGAVASAFRTANCEVRHTRRGRPRATIAFVKNGGTRNDYRN
jgi:hypothetical protein